MSNTAPTALRDRLAAARLYLCTDLTGFLDAEGRLAEERFSAFCQAVFAGGVDILQVRDKQVPVAVELQALGLVREAATGHGTLVAANDRADVALLAGVDVFHVGQTDLTTAQARTVLGPDVVLGRSCHTPAQVDAALSDEGLDYFCTGPIWQTPTKPGRAAVGLGLPQYAAARSAEIQAAGVTAHPFFAIGGIDVPRVPEVTAAGAERIAVVRAITQADDPEAAARVLREAVLH